MMKYGLSAFCALAAFGVANVSAGEVSVERGKQVSIVGGCHDCHTDNYLQTEGQLDPALALKGSALGWQGPWGTTYAKNLRITAAGMSEDEFVQYSKTFKTRPPMPYFNVHLMDESDIRSLHQYIKSLGEAGDPVPTAIGPGEKPNTHFIIIAPPTMP